MFNMFPHLAGLHVVRRVYHAAGMPIRNFCNSNSRARCVGARGLEITNISDDGLLPGATTVGRGGSNDRRVSSGSPTATTRPGRSPPRTLRRHSTSTRVPRARSSA